MILALAAATPLCANADTENALSTTLQVVANLELKGAGNVTVTPDGRDILSLHQFNEPSPRDVELFDSEELVPFPTSEWAGPRGADGLAETGLTAVLGLLSDADGVVWLLDNGGGDATKARLVG